ncbi:homoserine kinase [Demequina sediminicola]|uniref:homoserine kinase n=1 Tax=Demequina sediminicola TaxID=1095026 RepID=UPI001F00A742|nr:homoserine kinase [Demequina sediminicola]
MTVPATAGNLGPGFDAMGLALGVSDEIEVRAVAANGVTLNIEGEGADTLPRDESHLVVRALRAALDHVGASQVGLEITARNRIPHGRGLGSSAAAVVAGISAARGLIAEPEAISREVALQIATSFEGHPDNAAPAIWGGVTVAWMEGPLPHAIAVEMADGLETAVLVPGSTLPTSQARAVLPAKVPHADAAFNAGRSALLVAALAGQTDYLFAATEDRLHQDYRAEAMPAAMSMLTYLREKGLAAVVSGAGPSVLVIGRDLHSVDLEDGMPQWARGIGGENWRVVHSGEPVAGATVHRL